MGEVKDMFQVNVFGLVACTKAVLPYMVNKNEGHIINIASLAEKLQLRNQVRMQQRNMLY